MSEENEQSRHQKSLTDKIKFYNLKVQNKSALPAEGSCCQKDRLEPLQAATIKHIAIDPWFHARKSPSTIA